MTNSNFEIRFATVLKKEPFADKGINDAYKATIVLEDKTKRIALAKRIDFDEIVRELFSACVGMQLGLPIPSQFLVWDREIKSILYACEFINYPNYFNAFTAKGQTAETGYKVLKAWKGWCSTVAFDELIINKDRHLANFLWGGEDNFYLIDHGRTFGEPSWLERQNRLIDIYKKLLRPSAKELENAIRNCQKKAEKIPRDLGKRTLEEFDNLSCEPNLLNQLQREAEKLTKILDESFENLPDQLSSHLPSGEYGPLFADDDNEPKVS
ncbi:hypothetical protein [Parasutterella sp.]|uniref:hypothetical protein n=1 Tax=Parasutterella sp. TaxID=2049037 RepID=UPI003AB39816